MAQGRSTETISMIKWIRTSRLSIKNSLSGRPAVLHGVREEDLGPGRHGEEEMEERCVCRGVAGLSCERAAEPLQNAHSEPLHNHSQKHSTITFRSTGQSLSEAPHKRLFGKPHTQSQQRSKTCDHRTTCVPRCSRDGGVRASVSVLQQRVEGERTPGPSCPQNPAGGLCTWSCWSCTA